MQSERCRGRSFLPGTLSGGQVIRGVPEKFLFLFAAADEIKGCGDEVPCIF
jgi:hypothetical protein